MKTKNAVLAVVAFGLAIGGAFASIFADQNVYVHARLNSSTGPITCVRTNALCDDASQVGTCQITVSVLKPGAGGSQTASTSGTFKTYKVTCTGTPLADNQTAPVNAQPVLDEDDAIYELID